MAVKEQVVTDRYALYCGDSCEVVQSIPEGKIDLSIYSPPFCGLYNYSSNERDMSNCRSYNEFFEHYRFLVKQIARITKPGRMTAVHCADIPKDGANAGGGLFDLSGAIIRLHEEVGFHYTGRYHVWKDPWKVRMTTMMKGLAHQTICEDSTLGDVASADYLLVFRNHGENAIPVEHPTGLLNYAGARPVPEKVLKYRGFEGKQTENRFSQWVWRQYASAFWDDVRSGRVLPYKESRDPDDERHVHPLQLDIIERAVVLWSNPGETVLTPFMGVGSEVYGAALNGRRAIGIELKPSYYHQAVRNLLAVKPDVEDQDLFATAADDEG